MQVPPSSALVQSAGDVEYTKCVTAEEQYHPNECPRYDSKKSDGEILVMLEVWGNVEYPFIAIIPGSTLALSSSTW